MGDYLLKNPDQLPEVTNIFSTRIITRYRRIHINFKEIKAVLYAIELWLERLRGTRLVLHCNNEIYVFKLHKSFIKGSTMASLRDIAILMTKHNIYLILIWIPTKANQLVDNLSRFKYQKIANIYSQLRHIAVTSSP